MTANEYTSRSRPQEKEWRPEHRVWTERRRETLQRAPPARGAEFTGPSKADGYLDTPSPRRKIEPAHAVIKRNVKTQNMWKVMTGAPSDTTFTESEGSVMGSGTLSKQALEGRAAGVVSPKSASRPNGPEHNILTNELPGDAKPRATFKFERTDAPSRAEREASYRGNANDFEKFHGVRRHAEEVVKRDRFDHRFVRTNHVRIRRRCSEGVQHRHREDRSDTPRDRRTRPPREARGKTETEAGTFPEPRLDVRQVRVSAEPREDGEGHVLAVRFNTHACVRFGTTRVARSIGDCGTCGRSHVAYTLLRARVSGTLDARVRLCLRITPLPHPSIVFCANRRTLRLYPLGSSWNNCAASGLAGEAGFGS